MNWISVDSSTMSRMAYDAARRVLAVEFKNGTRYEYFDVPSVIFDQMKSSESKGKYMAVHIKGRFRYARV